MATNRNAPAVATARGAGTEQALANGLHAHGNPVDRLLSAIERTTGHKPRRSGRGYRVTCAVCGTASYKGSVTEAPNGSALANWFCGHTVAEQLERIGLSMADLFFERLTPMTPEEQRHAREWAQHARWRAALAVLGREATVVHIAAGYVLRGEAFTDADMERLQAAVERIDHAREVLA